MLQSPRNTKPQLTTRYQRLGIHWAAALPGFIALACIPFTIIFYKYGARIRAKCKYAADAERQMAMIMAARKKQAMQSDPEKAGNAAEAENRLPTEPGQQPSPQATGYQSQSTDPRLARSASRISRADRDEMASLHRTASHNAVPMDPAHRYEHEWTMYEALADRDEVSLDDEERMRLQELHERFDYAKQKKKAGTGVGIGGPGGSPVSRFKPNLPAAEEAHEHEHEHEHEHGAGRDFGLAKPI